MLAVICLIAVFGCKQKKPKTPQAQTPPPVQPQEPKEPKEPEQPPPPPMPYVPYKTLQTGTIFNGIQFKANLETEFGETAKNDRVDEASYSVEMNVKVKVPKAHQSLDELSKLNGKIATVLPGLAAALEKAKISPEYEELYGRKVNLIRTNLNRLEQLPSRHNFYDCETMLELQHPTTMRRALLVQADMDVDTDGSDGDRSASIEVDSKTFQPFTSYHWAKATATPNPFLPVWEKKVRDAEAKLTEPKADVQKIKADIKKLNSEISDLKASSYLHGSLDPFIVLPTTMLGGKTPFAARVGDYCVVIVDDILYPAIIGDAGPTWKVGEASLKLCKQINPAANGGNRSMNDLKATYLVFPGTGDKPWGAPDLTKWRTRCEQLLKEFGGYTGTLFDWQPPAPPLPVTPAVPEAPVVEAAANTPVAPRPAADSSTPTPR